ncbi:MAG TPA: cytochrome C oxidase subunit IV family protein [Thermomicrobiales bacterium]|nr:cytochrome C oxidase subunit IV family protein [Thermomicrobiales bacterium]
MATPSNEHAEAHAHPPAMQYVLIAAILSIITAVEVATYYIDSLEAILVEILIVLSIMKFSIVVGYYMHLKFDNKLFTWVFGLGLVAGGSVTVALIALFDRF